MMYNISEQRLFSSLQLLHYGVPISLAKALIASTNLRIEEI